jgi:hypothetical protein
LKTLFYIFIINICLISITSQANGVSPYLPLKTDPLFELELEKLATITKLPILTRPYHAATIYKYLSKVEDSHPALFQRLNTYIKRYKKTKAVTHFSAQYTHSFKSNALLANQRGRSLDDYFKVTTSSFWQADEHVIFNAGGTFYNGEAIPNNTYISVGWDVFQIDIGYREHWLSPTQEAALLLSTQAKPALNLTISNPTLLTDWNIKYELSLGILEQQEGIQFGRDSDIVSGKPNLLSMHLSLQPFSWWTVGFNRTFMFGGDKSVSAKDIWKAFIDPLSSDNCGGESDLVNCTQEFGNQQASLSNKFDLDPFNFPLSIYYEYAGEDTKNYSNYQLGNIAQNLCLFLPYLTDSLSLNIEYSKFHTAWYVHHIYQEGYANDKIKMGHWWGNLKPANSGAAGTAASLRLDWQAPVIENITLLYRTATVDSTAVVSYQRSHEIELTFKKILKNAFINLAINLGEDTQGEKFLSTSVSYLW